MTTNRNDEDMLQRALRRLHAAVEGDDEAAELLRQVEGE